MVVWGHRPKIVLRLLILKHLFDWSYVEREVPANPVYRVFTRD